MIDCNREEGSRMADGRRKDEEGRDRRRDGDEEVNGTADIYQ